MASPNDKESSGASQTAISKTQTSESRHSTENGSVEKADKKEGKQYKTIPSSSLLDLLNPKMRAALENPLVTVGWLEGLYGECFKVKLLGNTMTFLSSQRNVNKMLSTGNVRKEAHDFLRELRPEAGESLFTADSDSPDWHQAHRILMPAFGAMSVRNMYDEMVDILRTMLTRWYSHQGEPIDIPDQLTRLTLDTIALCSFDYRFNSFFKETLHPFVNDMLQFLSLSGRRTLMPLNKLFNFPQRQQWASARARLEDFAAGIYDERLKHNNEDGPRDLCHRMMNVADPETGEKLNRANISAQLVTFLIAGHETTSGMLSFALYYLVKNPSTMRKAQEEVDKIGYITQDSLNKMPYIDAVLKEALRLQPTAPMFAVSSDEDVELPSGHMIPKGAPVMINLGGLHKDPKVYGPDPDDFRPERMLSGGFENLPPNSWKPFGNGIRACIGRAFALQEAMLAVASIVQNFDLELVDPSYELKVKFSLTIKPDNMKMRLRRRTNAPPVFPLLSWEKSDSRDMPKVHETHRVKQGDGSRVVKVIFGSNSGSCEALANDLGAQLQNHGFAAEVGTMDSCLRLSPDDTVLICTASYEGKPCDNARQFMAYLESNPNLKGVKYSVFGAGHSDWVDTYMSIPRTVDSKMAELGAERIVQRGEGDVSGDFIGEFESWKELLMKDLGITDDGSSDPADQGFRFVPLTSKTLNVSVNQGLSIGKVIENKELVTATEDTEAKRHLRIELADNEAYMTGDYLSILPKNPRVSILRVLKRFNLEPDSMVSVLQAKDSSNNSSSSKKQTDPSKIPLRVYDLVESSVELSEPVQRRMLPLLASLCTDEKDKARIEALAGDDYATEVLEKRVSTLDLLEQCPSCDIGFDRYIKSLRTLHQRQYSISSSPLGTPNECTITIDILRGQSTGGDGEFQGVTSNYLAQLKEGDEISCTIRSSSNFHLPSDTAVPVVCFASGTGIAPFRAFFEERILQLTHGREDVGESVLFYGCRRESDFLYKSEFDAWQAKFPDKIKIYACYSRAQSKHKYVQDLVFEKRDEVLRLFRDGACFYTCGSASRLSHSLRQSFKDMVEQYKGDAAQYEKAKAFLEATNTNRYAVDIFN